MVTAVSATGKQPRDVHPELEMPNPKLLTSSFACRVSRLLQVCMGTAGQNNGECETKNNGAFYKKRRFASDPSCVIPELELWLLRTALQLEVHRHPQGFPQKGSRDPELQTGPRFPVLQSPAWGKLAHCTPLTSFLISVLSLGGDPLASMLRFTFTREENLIQK